MVTKLKFCITMKVTTTNVTLHGRGHIGKLGKYENKNPGFFAQNPVRPGSCFAQNTSSPRSFRPDYNIYINSVIITLYKIERERERKGLYVQSTQIGYIRTSKAWKKEKY